MPLSLRYLKLAISYKIGAEFVKKLHFYDLQSLILSFNIDIIQREFEDSRKIRLKERGISKIEHYSGKSILDVL